MNAQSVDQETLTQELRIWKDRLDRGEITETVYELAIARLLDSYVASPVADNASASEHVPFTMLDDLRPDLEIGPRDNRFRLVRKIGGGGMGRVWLARDLGEESLEGGERFKALKVVSPLLQDSPRALESLKREAVRSSRLSHPHIINVYGWRQGSDGWLFVVMDYLQGRDLDQLLEEEGPRGLGWRRSLELLRPMAAALEYAHKEHRLVHRDLKPGNVFITDQSEIKLLDFGLAYRLRRSSSIVNIEESHNRGTPQYMPPEAHIGGEPEDVAQDIYALSCMIYEMLTGSPPYSHEAAIQRSPALLPPPPKDMQPVAWEVLKSGFAYRKDDRPSSVAELVRGLIEAQETPSAPVSPWRRRLISWAMMVVVGVGVGVGYLAIAQPDTLSRVHAAVIELFDVRSLAAGTLRDELSDGTLGPLMISIDDGSFLMGSPADEPGRGNDETLHEVSINQPFALAKYEVTFAEYDDFAQATGRERPADAGWGRGNLPVVNVDWYDAMAYTEWLSEETGERYRLPTEAEWEYAARAGTETPFAFGDTISAEQANFNGTQIYNGSETGVDRRRTVPVDDFQPNPWGLQNMHGNVWEWTCSAYDRDYSGGEQRCSDGGERQVVRGGSWTNIPRALRSAYRVHYPADTALFFLGFRVARELVDEPLTGDL